jgi:glycosyltransferase involved in cell wall biosynthesis
MGHTLTLSTYTYNDAHLVDELLASVAAWSHRPDEIIVTDDGSAVPYVGPAGCRVVRLPENRGITVAKRTGISAATCDTILSIDCDARLAPNWLELVTPHLLRPEVGLASGSTAHAVGEDAVSHYLAKFGDNHNASAKGPVEFIPGNAFLIRRDVWRQVDGFGSHDRRVLEDHVLCARLAKAGFTLYADGDAKCMQIRRISRITMCKRLWSWLEPAAKQRLPPDPDVVGFVFEIFIVPLIERVRITLEADDLRLIYVDLLHVGYELCELLLDRARVQPSSTLYDEFRSELAARLAAHDQAAALFRSDLERLGHTLPPPARHPPWSDVFLVFDALTEAGFFDWMATEGIAAFETEDAVVHDFSSYA